MGFLNTVIGAGLGFAVGGPAGAAVGAGMGSGIDTNEANADRADASNAWSAAQYASRYQTTVKDIQAAGLNPMLAYSQGAGTAPTAQQIQFQNPASSAAQAYQTYAGAEQAIASAGQAEALTRQADANVDKIIEETKNLPVQREATYYTIRLLAEQAEKTIAETKNIQQATVVAKATVSKLFAETKLLNNQVDVEASLDKLGRTSKELAPAASILLDIIRGIRK